MSEPLVCARSRGTRIEPITRVRLPKKRPYGFLRPGSDPHLSIPIPSVPSVLLVEPSPFSSRPPSSKSERDEEVGKETSLDESSVVHYNYQVSLYLMVGTSPGLSGRSSYGVKRLLFCPNLTDLPHSFQHSDPHLDPKFGLPVRSRD